MAFLSLSIQKVKCNLLDNVAFYFFQLLKSKGVMVFGSELHESHVSWVDELWWYWDWKTTYISKKYLHYTNNPKWCFYNNRFRSEWFLASGIKLHAVARASHATQTVLWKRNALLFSKVYFNQHFSTVRKLNSVI